jgi:hypothetical protein
MALRSFYSHLYCSQFFSLRNVITGYNTDVEFGGVTYHIQTEDKGLDTPIILSLVYDRGTILAAKRDPYDDLIEKGFDEKLLAERLTKQHKIICAAIKKGRIEDLKVLTQQKRNARLEAAVAPTAELLDHLQQTENSADPLSAAVIIEPDTNGNSSFDPFEDLAAPIPMPRAPVLIPQESGKHISVPIVEGVAVVEIPEPLPIDAVKVISDLAGTTRHDSNKLSLDFIGDDEFYGGTKAYITVMVCRGASRKVVADAEVMVKVLGSSFRPLIFHSQTDKNGISTVVLDIPSFHSGRASILVRVISKGEEVEARRPIIHG